MVVSFESRRHRGACLGVDAVGQGMVFLKLVLTMCDGAVEKDTVTSSDVSYGEARDRVELYVSRACHGTCLAMHTSCVQKREEAAGAAPGEPDSTWRRC